MVVMGLLQNQWFRDPVRAARLLDYYVRPDGDGRNAFIADMLFRGCLTGRRIKLAFGDRAARRIVWEETTPIMTADPSTVLPVDHGHVRAALDRIRPGLIVAFGRVAASAFSGTPTTPAFDYVRDNGAAVIFAPHPAARGPVTTVRLKQLAAEVRKTAPNIFAEG